MYNTQFQNECTSNFHPQYNIISSTMYEEELWRVRTLLNAVVVLNYSFVYYVKFGTDLTRYTVVAYFGSQILAVIITDRLL